MIGGTIYLAANLARLDKVHNPLTENDYTYEHNQCQYRTIPISQRTHVKSPSYAFRTTIESEGEVRVMVVIRMKLSPDVDELASVIFGWV